MYSTFFQKITVKQLKMRSLKNKERKREKFTVSQKMYENKSAKMGRRKFCFEKTYI